MLMGLRGIVEEWVKVRVTQRTLCESSYVRSLAESVQTQGRGLPLGGENAHRHRAAGLQDDNSSGGACPAM